MDTLFVVPLYVHSFVRSVVCLFDRHFIFFFVFDHSKRMVSLHTINTWECARKITEFTWTQGGKKTMHSRWECGECTKLHFVRVCFFFSTTDIGCENRRTVRPTQEQEKKTKTDENNTCIGLCNVADFFPAFWYYCGHCIERVILNGHFTRCTFFVHSLALSPFGHFHYEDPKCRYIYLTWTNGWKKEVVKKTHTHSHTVMMILFNCFASVRLYDCSSLIW